MSANYSHLNTHVPQESSVDPTSSSQDGRKRFTPMGGYNLTISALDLATTPFYLERTHRNENTLLDEPRPLSSFMQNYKPYRGHFRGFQAYETRALMPFIRSASRSQPFLITLNGRLIPRRTVPNDDPQQYGLFTKQRWTGQVACNLHRVVEGLDLAAKPNFERAIKFHYRNYDNFWGNINSRFSFRPSRKRQRKMLFTFILKSILLIAFCVGFCVLVVFALFWEFNFGPLDHHLCGSVNPGPIPCEITPNPDVAGIGGRIALYIQTFIPIILLTFSSEGATEASWALVITSTAFVLSGLVSTATNQLTLYHVTLTAKMQGLPITIISVVEFNAPRERGPYLFLLARFRSAISVASLTWYTILAPCFGSQPQCNAYVVSHGWFSSTLAVASRARSASLRIAIFSSAFRILTFTISPRSTTLAVKSLFSDDARKKWCALPVGIFTKKNIPRNFETIRIWGIVSILDDNSKPPFLKLKNRKTSFTSQGQIYMPLPATTMRTTSPSGPSPGKLQIIYKTAILNIRNALWYPKVWRFIFALAIGGILVYDIEASISLNTVDVGENAWTYGQVLAVILTAVPVVQFLQFIGLAPSQKAQTKHVGKEKVL